MSGKKCYWKGPAGFSPGIGLVERDKVLSLSEKSYKGLLKQNLIGDEPDPVEKPAKKKSAK